MGLGVQGKKQILKFTVDCTQPVDDTILTTGDLEKFFKECSCRGSLRCMGNESEDNEGGFFSESSRFLFSVELHCLQSSQVLIRGTFPL